MIITRTPLRISLVGGGTDMPAFYSKHPGAVFSFAIDKYVYVSVNKKFDGTFRVSYSKTEMADTIDAIQHALVRESMKLMNVKQGLEVTSVADIPGEGTGLGSSSAFTVGLLKALSPKSEPSILAERAYEVEANMCSHPVGKQDQYASAIGGMNFMTFGKNSVNVRPIFPSSEWMHDFCSSSLLLWTGMTRDANDILKSQRKGFQDGGNIEVGKMLAHQAHDFMQEVADGAKIKRLGEIMDKTWKLKKKLSTQISNPKLDQMYEKAKEAGAYGGKLLGAGGGGFFFLFAPNYLHKQIVEATGLRRVDFALEQNGSEVIYHE